MTRVGLRAINRGSLALWALLMIPAAPASAHVKWFCPYNVAEVPRSLSSVLDMQFGQLLMLSVGLLMLGAITERGPIGELLLGGMDELAVSIRDLMPTLFRAVYGAFFVALWALGGVILTPELKTAVNWIPWLQLGIAACIMWRQTLPLAGAGIVVLYAYATAAYGVFHMLDYPIFLSAALYLVLVGTGWRLGDLRPLDVVRWGAAITLMWASVEKWAYPQWSYPLFVLHPKIGLGIAPPTYLLIAGMVEFALAFSLICTPLVRRSGAILLLGMFISATLEFGKVDALGHAPIIVILVAVAVDDARESGHHVRYAPVLFCAALAFSLAYYYGIHALLFPSTAA